MSHFVKDLSYVTSFIWGHESSRHARVRQLSVFLGWQVWKRTIAKPVVIDLFNDYRFIAYPDCGVSSRLLYTRIPDYKEIYFLRQYLSGGTFVDVGANVCLYPLLLADKIDHALLFEPNPVAAKRARENVALNGLSYNVYELALSDKTGIMELEDRGGVDTCNQMVPEGGSSPFPTRTVTGTTLDRFLEGRGGSFPPIKAIKIDVEGHENAALKGMRGCLEESRPELVLFEYLEHTNLWETLEFFNSVDYGVIRFSSKGPVLADERVKGMQNLAAVPRETLGFIGVITGSA